MARDEIRAMKRAMAAAGPGAPMPLQLRARESALALLARSIRFGHERLTLHRLVMAVQAGAAVTPEQWAHCERIVGHRRRPELTASLQQAVELLQQRRPEHEVH